MGVPPWELENMTSEYRDLALAFENSDNWAEGEITRRNSKKKGRR